MKIRCLARTVFLWSLLTIIPSGQIKSCSAPLMVMAPAATTYLLPTAIMATKWLAGAAIMGYAAATTFGTDVCYCVKNTLAWMANRHLSSPPAPCQCECHQQHSAKFLSYVQSLHSPAYITSLKTQLHALKDLPTTTINTQRINAIGTTLAQPNMVQRMVIHNAKQEAFLNQQGIPTGFMVDPYQKQLFHEAEQLTQQNASLQENPLITSYTKLNDLQSIETLLTICPEVTLTELLAQKHNMTPEQFAQLVKDTLTTMQKDQNCRLTTLLDTSQKVTSHAMHLNRDGHVLESAALLDFSHAATGLVQKIVDYDMHIARGIARGVKNGINPIKIVQNLGHAALFAAHTIWTAGSQIVRSNALGTRLLLHKVGIGSEASLLADIRAFEHEIEAHNAQVDKTIDMLATKYHQMSGPEFAGFLAETATEWVISGKAIAGTVEVASAGVKTLDAAATRMAQNLTETALATEGVPSSAFKEQFFFGAANDVEPLVKEAQIANDATKASGPAEVKIGSEIVNDVKQINSGSAIKPNFEQFAEGRLKLHYDKHVVKNTEWGNANITIEDYLKRAQDLLNCPVDGNIEGFISPNGYTFRYNRLTNEFATGKPNGTIETLYKPERGLTYWFEQVTKYSK